MPKGTLYFDLLLLKVGRSAKVAKPAPLRLPKRLAVEDRVLLLKVVGVAGNATGLRPDIRQSLIPAKSIYVVKRLHK
uniref:Uncharacterized protein n=1 Tax=Marseillevirus LCMAC202 TaxID=2506606 RepID=A0A481YYD1_9VIRU|nr:MAG: hypothetical protein LCMAC202_01710 [Marseillevirus LCMAC202]